MLELDPAKILTIRTYPDPILSKCCVYVSNEPDEVKEIKTLIQNMFLTMYHYGGVGLSANQVGVTKRVFVMDTSNSGQKRRAFVNPQILDAVGEERYKEGCLSFPNVFAFVKRAAKITVRAWDEEGKEFQLDLTGIDAVCFQHELDHLDGVTFYDHLSVLQKNLIKKRIAKLKK